MRALIRPELLRMIDDLQAGEVVIAENIDRLSRLPLSEAEKLVASIRTKGARLSIPGLVDLSEISADAQGVTKIVIESLQELLLKSKRAIRTIYWISNRARAF